MSTDQTLPLTSHQQSDVEAASDAIYAEAAEEIVEQGSGLDTAAILALAAIGILFNVLSPDLRTTSPLGLAFRDPALRRVTTLILGFMAVMLFVGEKSRKRGPVQIIAGGVLALYTLYVASFTFFGLDLLTDSILPTISEIAAIIGVIALWQPWNRLAVYRKTLGKFGPALTVFVAVVIVWQLIVTIFDIKAFLLPAPTVIGDAFLTNYPRLVAQGWQTFQNAWWGYIIGCGAGLLFGLVSARFVSFNRAMMPYAIAANSIPIIAFAPITNQWFGVIDPMSKITVVAVLTFFPVMINTVRGLTSAAPAALELMRSYAASDLAIFRKVRIPSALPFIFSALKVATTLSMIAAIVSEYFGGPLSNLGDHLVDDAKLSKFALVWSEIIIASLLGIAFFFVISLIERLVMPWYVAFRETSD